MDLTTIVRRVNRLLAGETLIYSELEEYLDATIDEVNRELNAAYPVFSDFTAENYPDSYPDYSFFPEQYVRTVVIPGAATKFYIQDTEGMMAAPVFMQTYENNLFYMHRDFSERLPEEWQAPDPQGFLSGTDDEQRGMWITNGFLD